MVVFLLAGKEETLIVDTAKRHAYAGAIWLFSVDNLGLFGL